MNQGSQVFQVFPTQLTLLPQHISQHITKNSIFKV